jgi:hypothetical protein
MQNLHQNDDNIWFITLTEEDKTFISSNLLEEIKKKVIRKNHSRANSGSGRTQVFGYGKNRRGNNFFANNQKYPELYKLLVKLGNRIVPDYINFTSIQVNHNYKTLKHIDKNNVGDSLNISFGNFEGGELVINDIPFQTKLNPVIFNGATNYHYNNEIIGDRYSLVYFCSIKTTDDKFSEVRQHFIDHGI